ncbi:MAG TPA: hypothetical protein VGB91_00640 [Rhizomicrobium sp.]
MVAIPGRLSEWCEALMVRLLGATGAAPAHILANGLGDLGREILAADRLRALVVARQPELPLCRSLIATGRPLLVVLDEPARAVRMLMTDNGLAYAEATRFVANCLASFVPLLGARNALVLRAAADLSEFATARRIADHFEFGVDDETLRGLARDATRAADAWSALRIDELGEFEASRTAPPPAAMFEDVPLIGGRGLAAHEAVLGPVWKHLNGAAPSETIWPPSLFYVGDAPSRPATEPVDVTGVSRCLIFGPYIRLPEGAWSCSVVLASTPGAVGMRMVAEVIAGVSLNRVDFEVAEAGIFEVEISFVHANPDLPIEVRLFNAEAAFEGEIAIGQVRMTPLAARRLAVA